MCSDNKWVPGASIIITCHVICKHNNLLLDDVDDLIHKLKTYKHIRMLTYVFETKI